MFEITQGKSSALFCFNPNSTSHIGCYIHNSKLFHIFALRGTIFV